MEKDEIAERTDQDLFGDEELWDIIPDDNEVQVNYADNPEKIGSINWIGGKPQLTFSSLCDKTKSIFTQVKGVNIIVRENEGENYIFKSGKEYIINIAKNPLKGVPKYTAFNHELAHYAFDSFSNQFPNYTTEELEQIPPEHHDKALELYRSIYNVIEDQRVESLLGDIYLGTGKRFRQMRRRLGSLKDKDHKSANPLDALHCAREYREESVGKRFDLANGIMIDVESKDGEASILLAKHYIQKVLNPWILKQLLNCKNPFDVKPDKDGNLPWRIDPKSPITCKVGLNNAFQDAFNENRSSDHRELDSDMTDEQEAMLKKALEQKLKDALEQAECHADDRLQEIKDKIEEHARKSKRSFMPNSKEIQIVDRSYEENTPIPNMRIAQSLNKILKLIQARNKPRIRDNGDELSIPAVIRRKARGYGDVFIKRVPRQKLAILISIDSSGSMEGLEIDTARDMMATLYKSIVGIDGIELRGVIWAGDSNNCMVSQVHSYKECHTINTMLHSGGTPTPYGVKYSERILEEMKGKKKLLIVITDGYPNSAYDSNLNAEQMVRKEINRARANGIGTLGMMVGGEGGEEMKTMFGADGYIDIHNMEQASNAVIKKFRKIVLSQMNSR